MYKKLLSASFSCLLFGTSSVTFGMNGPEKQLAIAFHYNENNQNMWKYYNSDGDKITLESLNTLTYHATKDTQYQIWDFNDNEHSLVYDNISKTQLILDQSSEKARITLTDHRLSPMQIDLLEQELKQNRFVKKRGAKAYVITDQTFFHINSITQNNNVDLLEWAKNNSTTPKINNYPLITDALCDVFSKSHDWNFDKVKKTSQICFTTASADDIVKHLKDYIPQNLNSTTVGKDSAACINDDSYIQLIQLSSKKDVINTPIFIKKDKEIRDQPMINVLLIDNEANVSSTITNYITDNIPLLIIVAENLRTNKNIQDMQKIVAKSNNYNPKFTEKSLTDDEIAGIMTPHTIIKTNENPPKKPVHPHWFFKNPVRNGLVLGAAIGITACIAEYLTGRFDLLDKLLRLPASIISPLLAKLIHRK